MTKLWSSSLSVLCDRCCTVIGASALSERTLCSRRPPTQRPVGCISKRIFERQISFAGRDRFFNRNTLNQFVFSIRDQERLFTGEVVGFDLHRSEERRVGKE